LVQVLTKKGFPRSCRWVQTLRTCTVRADGLFLCRQSETTE